VAVQIDYRLGDGGGFILETAVDPSRAAVVDNAVDDAQTAIDWIRTSATDLGVDPQRVAVGGTSAGAMTAAGAALTATGDSRPCTLVSISGAINNEWVGADPVSGLFVHGDADDVVPFDSSVSAVDEINRAGGAATLVTISGAGHEISGVPESEVVAAAAGWLREHAAARCG
jgi:Predicted esterase